LVQIQRKKTFSTQGIFAYALKRVKLEYTGVDVWIWCQSVNRSRCKFTAVSSTDRHQLHSCWCAEDRAFDVINLTWRSICAANLNDSSFYYLSFGFYFVCVVYVACLWTFLEANVSAASYRALYVLLLALIICFTFIFVLLLWANKLIDWLIDWNLAHRECR